MKENITAARPYSQAVFEQAQEDNDLGKWSEMLKLLKLVVSDSHMQTILDNPTLGADFFSDFILEICGDHLTEKGKNFVGVLVDAGRLPLVPHIYRLYEQRRTEAEGVVEVEVVSAFQLEETEKNRISVAIGKRLGKKINITTQIDKSLIGGSIIRAGDSVIDASIKGRLRQLGSELAE